MHIVLISIITFHNKVIKYELFGFTFSIIRFIVFLHNEIFAERHSRLKNIISYNLASGLFEIKIPKKKQD